MHIRPQRQLLDVPEQLAYAEDHGARESDQLGALRLGPGEASRAARFDEEASSTISDDEGVTPDDL